MTLNENHTNPRAPLADRFRTYLPVVIDIETGGFNSATDAILEISAVILEMDQEESLVIKQTFLTELFLLMAQILKRQPLNLLGLTLIIRFELRDPKKSSFRRCSSSLGRR